MDYEVHCNGLVFDAHTLARAKQVARDKASEHKRPATVVDRTSGCVALTIDPNGTEHPVPGYVVNLSAR